MNLSAHTLGPLACLVMPGGDPALLHALLHGEADSRQHRRGKAFGTLMSPLIRLKMVLRGRLVFGERNVIAECLELSQGALPGPFAQTFVQL